MVEQNIIYFPTLTNISSLLPGKPGLNFEIWTLQNSVLKCRPWLTSYVLSLIPTSLSTLAPSNTGPGGDFHVHSWTHQSTLSSSIHSTCIP